MSKDPKYIALSIVVVNKNGGHYLEPCLKSIFDQGYPNLEVIMVDGLSSDNSLEIIESYRSKLAHTIIEEDSGQYDAVQKGFERSTGDVMAWINSDDKYLPGAFATSAEIFEKFNQVDWLMGYPGEFDQRGALFRRISLPWARWSKLRYYTYDFQFIQQESCFWRRSLWEKAGSRMDAEIELAGDLGLWLRFFRHAKLYTTISCLAGFRQHSEDQRSRSQREAYLEECRSLIHQEIRSFSKLERLNFLLIRTVGFMLWPFHFYEIPLLKYLYLRVFKIPPILNYNVDQGQHEFSEQVMKLPPIYLGKTSITRAYLRTLFGWKKR